MGIRGMLLEFFLRGRGKVRVVFMFIFLFLVVIVVGLVCEVRRS